MSDLTALRRAIAESDNTLPYDQFRAEMDADQPEHDESPNEFALRKRMDGIERSLIDVYRRIHQTEDRIASLYQAINERGQGNI